MDKIQIKCTSCGQKFAVTESYIGRMVECGACDQKFKVEGAALVRQKKHYPGEKSDANAEVFAKTPKPKPENNQDVSFQTANYQNVSAEYAQPPSPLKTLMICAGAIFILSFIALFLLGGREEGTLKGLNDTKRLILAGFVALAGSILIIIGSRKKTKGLLLSLILGGALVAMPFIFPEVSNVKLVEKDTSSTTVNEVVEPEKNEETLSSKIEKYKRDIGFGKVEASRITLDNPDNLKALVLLESKFQDLDIILPYLQFAIGFKEAPVTYTFGREVDGKPATLITFITEYPIEKVFEATKKFGVPKEMDELRSTLKVVEVVVNRNILKGQPTELTNDSNHPRYFDANYYELIGIDRSKQIDAVRRLRTATVKGRQADISSALTGLITKNDHELSKEVIATLYHWTRPEYENDQSVINYAKEIVGTQNMSRPVMDYLADKEVPGSAEILSKQWASVNGHLLWESHLVRAKKRGEQAVIYALPNLKNTHYKSVASILNKIGTSRSISAINTVIHKASPEDQKYLKATIDEIKSRQ